MAHVYDHGHSTRPHHVHLISLLLLAAVVLFVMLMVPRHKPIQTFDPATPTTAPR